MWVNPHRNSKPNNNKIILKHFKWSLKTRSFLNESAVLWGGSLESGPGLDQVWTHLLARGEEHGRLVEVGHAVELGALGGGVVQLVQLLAARGRHLPLGRPPLLVAGLPLRTLQHKKGGR